MGVSFAMLLDEGLVLGGGNGRCRRWRMGRRRFLCVCFYIFGIVFLVGGEEGGEEDAGYCL